MTKRKLEFAPGCFDGWDGTDEELAELVTELHRLNDSGEMDAIAVPLDEAETDEFLKMIAGRNPHH